MWINDAITMGQLDILLHNNLNGMTHIHSNNTIMVLTFQLKGPNSGWISITICFGWPI